MTTTTKAATTPGPWEVSVNEGMDWDVCAAGGGDMIADLSGCDNARGNAALIAAAPLLRNALESLVDRITALGLQERFPDLAEAQRAVALAEVHS